MTWIPAFAGMTIDGARIAIGWAGDSGCCLAGGGERPRTFWAYSDEIIGGVGIL